MKQDTEIETEVSLDETSIADLRDLRAFCLAVDLRSFTAAARFMSESKPTISRRIARLERALNVHLLNRSPRRVEATEEGQAYRRRLAQVFELLEDANAQARGSSAAPSGRLRLTAPPEFGSVLAPILVEFGERFPQVSVETIMTQRVLDLESEQVDVALRFSFGLPDSSLVAHRLLDLELVFVASPRYLARSARPLRRLQDLTEHRTLWLALGNTSVRPTAARTKKGAAIFTAFRSRSSLSSTDMSFVRELALAGGGVAALPSVTVARELERGALVAVLAGENATPPASLYLVHQGGRPMTPKLQALLDHFLRAFGVSGRRISARRR